MRLRLDFNAPVVLIFSLAAAIVYLINEASGNTFTPLVSLSSDFNAANPFAYLSLFTYVLGHANGEHLMGNLMLILLLGPVLEEKYGSKKLLIMILFTTLLTGILNVLLLTTGIMGASGIVFMFIILVSFVNVKRGKIPITFLLIVVLYIGQEVLQIFQQDNISQFGHIAGGLFGALFGFSKWMQPRQDAAQTAK